MSGTREGGTWRIRLEAISNIAEQVRKDVAELNAAARSGALGPSVGPVVPGVAPVAPGGSAPSNPSGYPAAAPGAIPPVLTQVSVGMAQQIGKNTDALRQFEQATRSTGNALDRVLGKILPGGGLGNAIGGAAGGGLAATAAVGAGFVAFKQIESSVASAREMNSQSEAIAAALERINRFADPTIDALSSLGAQLEVFGGIVSKLTANSIAQSVNMARLFGGGVASTAGGLVERAARGVGLNGVANAIGSVNEFLADQSARGLLGLTGDTSEQDVGRAQKRLAAAQRRRADAASRAPSAGINLGAIGYVPPTDEMSRMGLFVGAQSETAALQREANTRLREIERAVREIGPAVADNL